MNMRSQKFAKDFGVQENAKKMKNASAMGKEHDNALQCINRLAFRFCELTCNKRQDCPPHMGCHAYK